MRDEKDKELKDSNGEKSEEKVRVTDKRRISPDNLESSAEPAAETAPKPTYVEQLEARTLAAEQKLTEVQARFEQLRDELRRETDATRQRLTRAADERIGREKAAFIAKLLPVIDNLRRALEAAEQQGAPETLLDGLRGTIAGFESVLAAEGVEPVPSVGERFDPHIHEAVEAADVEPEQDGIVLAEYTRGYRMGDQLLRPARVKVGRARAGAQKAGE